MRLSKHYLTVTIFHKKNPTGQSKLLVNKEKILEFPLYSLKAVIASNWASNFDNII